MTYAIENIWSFKTKNFRVDMDAMPEDDLDLSWDEDGSAREGIESGKYVVFCARATVWYDGEIVGQDFLGQCIYESIDDFRDHVGLAAKARKDGCNYGSYFVDMIHQAIREARQNFTKERPKLRAA